jgi:hypothetical protein
MQSKTDTRKKTPYEPPTLQVRERLAEAVEGMLPGPPLTSGEPG